MKENTTNANLTGKDVKSYNPRPDAPRHTAPQPVSEKRSNDPSSTCYTSSRYPIPSSFDSRIWDRG